MSVKKPICIPCYMAENQGKVPVVSSSPGPDTCSECGTETFDGVFVTRDK